MDYSQSNQTNFDNHFNKFKSYESFSKRASIDSAYDSFLFHNNSPSNSLFSNNQSDYNTDTNSSNGSLFSQPNTPVKSFIFNGNNTTTTPDFKQQYVADINGFYFASIRQSSTAANIATPSTCSSYTSPFKSVTNSPLKYSSDSFVHKRDTFSTKLLRSPAFKLEQNFNSYAEQSPAKPFIKSFSSRFTNLNLKPPEPVQKTTPTEEEFMELLVANHHIPDNPEFLIGRHMGLEQVDILSELNKKNMSTIIENIFSNLSVSDCVRVGCVSREWRSLIKQDHKRNKERVRLIKQKRLFFETFKENNFESIDMIRLEKRLLKSNLSFDQMTMDSPVKDTKCNQRKSLMRLTCEQVALRENESEMNGSHFKPLNVNCMENLFAKNIKQTNALKVILKLKIFLF